MVDSSLTVIADRIVAPGAVITVVILLTLLFVSLIAFYARHVGHNLDDPISLAVVMLAVAIIGSGAGYIGGLSRIGAVGDIVAGVMGVFAAGAVYFLGASRSRGVTIALNAVAFTVALVVGFRIGADVRSKDEVFSNWERACLAHYTADSVQSLESITDKTAAFVDRTCAEVLARSRLIMNVDSDAATRN